MPNPIILSDDDDEEEKEKEVNNQITPPLIKKPRITHQHQQPNNNTTTIFILDDDPTPQKPGPTTPSIVMSDDVSIVKCTFASSSSSRVSIPNFDSTLSVCLESDNEDSETAFAIEKLTGHSHEDTDETGRWSHSFFGSMDSLGDGRLTQSSMDGSSQPLLLQDDNNQVNYDPDKENCSMEQHVSNNAELKGTNVSTYNKSSKNKGMGKRKLTKEERIRLIEEKKQKKEEEKLQKAVLKAQAAELKKLEKEKQKWEKGKFASKSIVAELDTKVVEQGSIGGHLLTRFSEKGLTYRLTSNPIEKSIVWTMSVPEHISQLSSKETEVKYVLIVFDAEEFCNLVISESLLDHVSRVRSCYPSYTVCYLTNRLMAYINKRDKEQYKNPESANDWRRPPIEEVLARLTTHFVRVHYRHCVDEAEIAEHVVGLTSSLASCQFRNKLTRLSVNANGSLIPKDSVDKNLIKKSPWLKALVAIPKVQPRFAVAIWKKYPTMKSLLCVYMDPSKSVHEKEFLLEDLTAEGLLGGERRVGRICSKRIYRIIMAQNGSIKTDDVEDGADFFTLQQS